MENFACAFMHRRVVRIFIIIPFFDTSRVRLYTGALYVFIIIPFFDTSRVRSYTGALF
jgi:hypothetical protein